MLLPTVRTTISKSLWKAGLLKLNKHHRTVANLLPTPYKRLIDDNNKTDKQTRGLVSKETVVLHRWGCETQNFGFLK